MREDIKKKFLDILFEPEDVEKKNKRVVVDAPLEDITPIKSKEQKKVTNNVEVSQPKKTIFVDADYSRDEEIDIEVSQIKEKIINKDYEFTQNISPIFGIVDNSKKNNEPKILTDDSQTSRPPTSYLGTILSPIFGYDASRSETAFQSYKDRIEDIKDNGFTSEESEDSNPTIKEEVIDNTNKENETTSEKIDDIVDIVPEDYYSEDDEQLFKELSLSDIFKTDDEDNDVKKENKQVEEKTKVSYTSLFDEKGD